MGVFVAIGVGVLVVDGVTLGVTVGIIVGVEVEVGVTVRVRTGITVGVRVIESNGFLIGRIDMVIGSNLKFGKLIGGILESCICGILIDLSMSEIFGKFGRLKLNALTGFTWKKSDTIPRKAPKRKYPIFSLIFI